LPAYIDPINHAEEWWVNGVLHRENGPAIKDRSGEFYFRNGLYHREDGPAFISDGRVEYWINGVQYEEGVGGRLTPIHPLEESYEEGEGEAYEETHYHGQEPTIEYVKYNNGREEYGYWKHGRWHLHREDGPAFVMGDGDVQEYYQHDRLHRVNGPAVIGNGRKEWWFNGLLHREDGPAIEYDNGRVKYWIHGVPHEEGIGGRLTPRDPEEWRQDVLGDLTEGKMPKDFFEQWMDGWFKDEVLQEGEVTREKAKIMDTINHDLAAKIVVQAQETGLKVEANYIDDIDDAIQPAVISVQLGSNSTFQDSQWMTVEVYDDNNIKARLTDAVRDHMGLEDGYLAFESLDSAMSYLGKIYAQVTGSILD
jgi:hypothetical protein